MWQKRPTRIPTQLSPSEKKGSRFISFTPATPPEEMFLKFWNEPSEVILKGINERSTELFQKQQTKEMRERKNPELYTKNDLLAFVAAWFFMDCTPLRQRKQFWRKFR